MEQRRRDFLRVVRRAAVAGALLPLAACGFTPLYAEGEDNVAVSAELATVRIDPLRDRVGQQMHNFLRDRLNPNGQPVSPNYQLSLQIEESLSELGVRRDETATRANLKLTTNFLLRDVGSGEKLLSGRSTSTTSYDILENPFATTISERDARERALREVADDIQTRLAVYFANS